MIAIAFGHNWHASWWEWHVLMAVAFGLVAFVARHEYRRRRSTAAVFKDLYLEHTGELDRPALCKRAQRPRPTRATGHETLARTASTSATRRRSSSSRPPAKLRRLDELFSPYLSPQLMNRLREQPGAGELGGEQREISVLFADLQGFTAFSERSTPPEVVAMLNAYWAEVVPVVAAEDGMIERFAGDAVLVVFNAATDQPDHAQRAARAALGFADASEAVARGRPEWPRFRVGVNSGPAVIGNVGAAGADELHRDRRHDEPRGAPPGPKRSPSQVVIGATTAAELTGADSRAAGCARAQGQERAVQAFRLVRLG